MINDKHVPLLRASLVGLCGSIVSLPCSNPALCHSLAALCQPASGPPHPQYMRPTGPISVKKLGCNINAALASVLSLTQQAD